MEENLTIMEKIKLLEFSQYQIIFKPAISVANNRLKEMGIDDLYFCIQEDYDDISIQIVLFAKTPNLDTQYPINVFYPDDELTVRKNSINIENNINNTIYIIQNLKDIQYKFNKGV
jgi:hypothetical protein